MASLPFWQTAVLCHADAAQSASPGVREMFGIDFDRYRLLDLSTLIVPPGTEERPLEISLGSLADDT